MSERQTTQLLCPKCKAPRGTLLDPGNPDKPVLIFACEACGNMWTQRNWYGGNSGLKPSQ